MKNPSPWIFSRLVHPSEMDLGYDLLPQYDRFDPPILVHLPKIVIGWFYRFCPFGAIEAGKRPLRESFHLPQDQPGLKTGPHCDE